MKTNHTPGPWATDIDIAIELIRKGEDIQQATVYINHGSGKGGEICALRHDPDNELNLVTDPEQVANAKLIAFAPQLLDLVERLSGLLDLVFEFEGDVFGIRHNDANDILSEARKAIRAATVDIPKDSDTGVGSAAYG